MTEHEHCQCCKCMSSAENQEGFGQTSQRYNDQSASLAITGMQEHQLKLSAQWRSLVEDERQERLMKMKLLLPNTT